MVSYLEQQEDGCSGVCRTGLFYYAKPLSDGIPQKTCLSVFKQQIDGNATYLGIAVLVTGIIGFITWLVQYALWKTYIY